MKKVLTVSLSVLVGFVLAVVLLGLSMHVRAGGGASVASENGDVNGDADIDVSDVVYLLKYLFSGGLAPTACADNPD